MFITDVTDLPTKNKCKEGGSYFYKNKKYRWLEMEKQNFLSCFISEIPNFSHIDYFRKSSRFCRSIPLIWSILMNCYFWRSEKFTKTPFANKPIKDFSWRFFLINPLLLHSPQELDFYQIAAMFCYNCHFFSRKTKNFEKLFCFVNISKIIKFSMIIYFSKLGKFLQSSWKFIFKAINQ